MSPTDILYEQEPEKQKPKPKRVDLAFEQMIVRCGVGCLINDIAMDEADYVRLELAFSRLLGSMQ